MIFSNMDTQIWIIGQILVDVIMVGLLVWFVRFHYRRRTEWRSYEMVIHKSETILREMEKISHVLEKNLEEKKELSRNIMEQLDQGMTRAQDAYRQISGVIPKSSHALEQYSTPSRSRENLRSSIRVLMQKGLSREEAAHHLNISVSEIDLLLKWPPPGKKE